MNFTIEKHLEQLSLQDDKARIIYSIWNLNKKTLKLALSSVQITFPHYSIHDYSHADTIINNIELFLGQKRIGELSATDAWLILMSAYTHDIGMIVFMKEVENKMDTPEFIEELKTKSTNKKDKDLAESAQLILNLLKIESSEAHEKGLQNNETVNITYALKIKRAITILSAELFRKIHHEQSRDIIKGINETFYNEFNKFYSHDIPIRFLQALGDIAYSHGIDFYKSMEILPLKSNGYCSDYMHPRFISCLLRLGDLLDVDDKRFNQFSKSVFSTKKVAVSTLHEIKHASITHLLVTPENIEVTVDCKEDENVFRIANQWFDWLKDEIEKQNHDWHQIRPSQLSGLAPTVSRNKVKVLFNGTEADDDLFNLQFNISKEKVFEIFEGKALYEDPSFVFLREISQNAVDATKIQLWKDIEKGVYDFTIRKHLNWKYGEDASDLNHDELISKINFPDDIPADIYHNYPVSLNINWQDKEKTILKIEVKDKGCGIDKSTLLRMTNNVGESRNSDTEYLRLKKRLPFFLHPTGAFGLGLQSIFLVSTEFEVLTKSESDIGWEIIFRSARTDEYISAKRTTTLNETGTLLTISILKDEFEKIFSLENSYNQEENFDFFTDRKGSPYIYEMISFIKANILNQPFIKCKVVGEMITIEGDEDDLLDSRSEEIAFVKSKPEFLVTLNVVPGKTKKIPSQSEFRISEFIERKMGSNIIVKFPSSLPKSDVNYYSPPKFNNLYAVRNIDIEDDQVSFFATNYCAVKINFLSPESDKILNIARSKLITKTKENFDEHFIEVIIPTIFPYFKRLLEENYERLRETYGFTEEQLAIIYLHINLTYFTNSPRIPKVAFETKYYGSFTFPESFLSFYNRDINNPSSLSSEELFNLDQAYISLIDTQKVSEIRKEKEELSDSLSKVKEAFVKIYDTAIFSDHPLIIWSLSYFRNYLYKADFVLTQLIHTPQFNFIYAAKITRNDSSVYTEVQLPKDGLKSFLKEYITGNRSYYRFNYRASLYPITPYARVLAVKQSNDFYLPWFCNHCIISPFLSREQFVSIAQKLREAIEMDDRNNLLKIIKEQYLNQLINDKLVEYVLNNGSLSSVSDRSVKQIKNTYLELIVDLLSCIKDDDTIF